MMIEPVDWDSSFFGLRIGKLRVDQFLSDQEVLSILRTSNDFDLIYVFSDAPLSIPKMEKRCKLVDEKVKFKYDWLNQVKEPLTKFDSLQIKEFEGLSPSKKLIDLALQSGTYSRFYTDRQFPSQTYVNLYTEWIARSVDKTIADKTIVAVEREEPSGFITYKIRESKLAIGLFAVDATSRGKGIGQRLIWFVLDEAAKSNTIEVTVETQRKNQIACSFYERMGFVMTQATNIYHFWR